MAKKLLTVIGARPQFIKASALSAAVAEDARFVEVMVHTGQHFNAAMSEVFFSELNIPPPQYNLGIHSLPHGAMTGRMLEALEHIMRQEKPDVVVLYGDTNSTLAGALAASKLNIEVAHIEAGLRSYNWTMPEEQNRVLTDRLSHYLFVPAKNAAANLLKEGISEQTAEVVEVGDIMYEVFLRHFEKAKREADWLQESELVSQGYVLASIHRQENVDNTERLKSIFAALDDVHDNIPVLCPMHPRTSKALKRLGISTKIKVVEPLSYLGMLSALLHAKAVVTDSGGLQKEAYYAQKPCFTLRNETEWTELVELNANFLVKDTAELPALLLPRFLDQINADFSKQPYGNGKSARSILNALL